ncbi:MAG: gamma-glutamyltransferase [Gemmatimonadota bacterium]
MALPTSAVAQQTYRPPLHGQEWMAITGKPLAATAGAMIFHQGGNAVDAAAAMLGATATMWDVLSWGGETQALIYNPNTGEVLGLNALGVAPTGATAEFFHQRGMHFPPATGPLAAVTPGTPGGLMVMVAEWGRLSLAEVLAPAIRMADGYPMEALTAGLIVRDQEELKQWRYSTGVFFPHLGSPEREAPYPGEVFRQPDLAATLRKLVEAESQALARGATREEAILAAYDRFYRGDIAEELVRGTQEEGGLITLEDLDLWEVKIEEPVSVNYKGIDVYKLTSWTQGPALLQALNILENADLQAMGYNSTRYLHTLYQAMNMAFADRDFYYSDPAFDPQTPIQGLLSEEYARQRWNEMDHERNDPRAGPGGTDPLQGEVNPYRSLLEAWEPNPSFLQEERVAGVDPSAGHLPAEEAFTLGTTSVHAADAEGWVVSIVPSGGWIPAVIAGRTGVGLSQRMQSFVTDVRMNPYNVVEPGKRPRVTLTPSMALKDGRPLMAFGVQGGDGQDQNLLQFFLNMVEFDMTVQEAVEAANMNSSQMRGSFGSHVSEPGRMLLQSDTPPWVRGELERLGYSLRFSPRTSGPITAIWFDWEHNTIWGGASHHGEDYGVAW